MIITTGSVLLDSNKQEYILDSIIGRGGFGTVYQAHRTCDDAVFAVKTFNTDFSDQDAVLSFQKELQRTRLISSDHVIKYEFINDGVSQPEYPPFIIMEYAEGGTLGDAIQAHRIRGTFFETNELLEIIQQLIVGMQSVNSELVHRDIKPENILYCAGKYKISDFGLSKIVSDSTNTMTFKGYGTLKYCAPEAWKNEVNTVQMDIYSMGIVFYELATLTYPYLVPKPETPENIKEAHLYQPVGNPQTINKDLPPALVSVILKMLEKPTQRRIKSWDEINAVVNTIDAVRSHSMGVYVVKALEHRNAMDTEIQSQKALEQKRAMEKEEHCKLVISQFENDIMLPINEFVDSFNASYAGSNVTIEGLGRKSNGIRNSYKIRTNGTSITIKCEVVLKENHTHQVKDIFDDYPRTVNYQPTADGKEILLWAQICDSNELGFNILLLRAKDSYYGDWYCLENTNGLTRTPRPEPFGFSLEELPKEIVHLKALHIYNLHLFPLKTEYLFDYISERM